MENATDAPASTAPDWATMERELSCPLCDYNLRGLAEPRCPECGYRFEWAELIRARELLHPYLFEHHPESNTWSYFRTFFGGLRPARFWFGLHPAQPSRPRRLVLYWALSLWLPVLVLARYLIFGSGILTGELPSAAQFVNNVVRWLDSSDLNALLVVELALWPWLSLAALLIFQESMHRRRIRKIHVLRTCLYACDFTTWLWPILLVLSPVMENVSWDLLSLQGERGALLFSAILIATVSWYRMGRAYQLYLKFDRPFLTVLAAQVIVALLVMVIAIN